MESDSRKGLDILHDRIRNETSSFEEREQGKPFLPKESDFNRSDDLKEYCFDIEQVLEISPSAAYRSDIDSLVAYHANYMFIPTDGLFVDSVGEHSFFGARSGDSRAAVVGLLDEFSRFVLHDKDAFVPRPANVTALPIPINYPFLLILYIGGEPVNQPIDRTVMEPKYFQFHGEIFHERDKDGANRLQKFHQVLEHAARDCYCSLHLTSIPTGDRNRIEQGPTLDQFEEAVQNLQADRSFAQSSAGQLTLEAITLHFQRQWGDREASLLEQARIQSLISHNVCHDLYSALENLNTTEAILNKLGNGGALNNLLAAKEGLRSCFAAPWLVRHRSKQDPRFPIWRAREAPTAEDIERLFRLFDRKLFIAGNAAPRRKWGVRLGRTHSIDERPYGESLEITLGDGLPQEAQLFDEQDDLLEIWPLAYDHGASTFEREGQRSLLFSPHFEAVRNAINSTKDMDKEAASRGIDTSINIASDGSMIEGSVRNALSLGYHLSEKTENLKSKLEQMSDGLSAEVIGADRSVIVRWRISFR